MNVPAALLAVAVVAAPALAAAQPGLSEPRPHPGPTVADDSDDRSPGLALSLSLLGTAAGYATLIAAGETESDGLTLLGLGGIVIGPSLGHFYAGEVGRGITHSLIRVGAGGVIMAGAVVMFSDCWGSDEECDGSAGPALMIGGLVLGGASTLYSIIDSPAAASRHNQARRRRFALTPTPLQGPDRSIGYGVALGAEL
jgi:hypothetical protein